MGLLAAARTLLAVGVLAAIVPLQSVGAAPRPQGAPFVWEPDRAPAGSMVIAVSLADQQLYVYRSGRLIGRSLISSGKRGHDTPTGVFPILQKNKDHR